jgi:hypothetical protein
MYYDAIAKRSRLVHGWGGVAALPRLNRIDTISINDLLKYQQQKLSLVRMTAILAGVAVLFWLMP